MSLLDLAGVSTRRELLAGTEWPRLTERFGRLLRRSTRTPGGLLVVGTPDNEPWHVAAHLDEESRLAGIPELLPTLVRYNAPPNAPKHLAFDLRRLELAQRGESVLVVAPDEAPEPLLERLTDARRQGATVLAVDQGDRELEAVAHDTLIVPSGDLTTVSFDSVTHLLTAATVTTERRGLRDQVGRLLDRVTGSPIE